MTPKRKFILKSNTDNVKKKWMRAITQLRKYNKKPKTAQKKTTNSTHAET